MTIAKGVASPPPVTAAILESSPEYAAMLTAVVRNAGWEPRALVTYTQLVHSVEASGAQLVFISSRDVPENEEALTLVRRAFAGPLVVLVDRDEELKSPLRNGATLVVKKPFDPEYLSLAVSAVLARDEPLNRALAQGALLGDLKVRLADHTIERRGRRQALGPAEWQLFAFLMAHPRRILDRHELARGAWGMDLPGREAEVELYVSRLRHKVELNPRHPDLILTVRGRGYQLDIIPEPMTSLGGGTQGQTVLPLTTMISYWQGAYEELVRVQTRIIERTRGMAGGTAKTVRNQLLGVDLPSLENDLERCESRLAFWSAWGL
ncbi:MAG: response regulator transcription factor [Candidatus Dormiibacterota bacterium]